MRPFAMVVTALLALSLSAGSAGAALRVPQVPVQGGTLQGYLNSQGESIDVLVDQQDTQLWQSTVSNNSTFTVQVELGGNAASNMVGLYNGTLAAPPLYQVFPGAASAGWFAVASFRTAPIRVVVNLFDSFANLVGTSTYLGADANNFGFYLNGPGGLFWTQDSRNPGGAAQALSFFGTGANSGQWWICFEDTSVGAGSDRDYDDAVLFMESISPVVPVTSTTWGSLKALVPRP